MKKMGILTIFIVLLVVLFITFFSDENLNKDNQPVKIGFIGALSGVGSAIGVEELRGVRLAVEEANASGGILGREIQIITEDVSLDKLRAGSSAVTKLIEIDEVVAIVGPQWDEPASVILPITEKSQMLIISPDVTSDLESSIDYDFFFSTWYDNKVGIEELLSFAKKRGLKNIAIIRPFGGGFFQYTRNLFITSAPDYQINIVADVNVGNPIATDFHSQIVEVKNVTPDAIFIVQSDPSECSFMKQLRELDLRIPVLSTEAAGNKPSLDNCAEVLDNLFFSTPKQTELRRDFNSVFEKRFGEKPLYPTVANSYDAANILIKSLRKSKLEGGRVLRDIILSSEHTDTISLETIKFDKKGFILTPDDSFEIQTVKNGAFVSVE